LLNTERCAASTLAKRAADARLQTLIAGVRRRASADRFIQAAALM